MKGFGKRFRIIISFLLLISLLTVTVSATSVKNCSGSCSHSAALGDTHYDTLSEAVTAAKDGNTITLLKDVTITAPVRIDKALVLDLGGYTVTADLPSQEQAALVINNDTTVTNGTVISSIGSCMLVVEGTVILDKTVTLEASGKASALILTASKDVTTAAEVSATILSTGEAPAVSVMADAGICRLSVLEDAKITSQSHSAIVFDCAGELKICDGMIQAKQDTITIILRKDRQTDLHICGGTILSEEGQPIAITAEEDVQIPAAFVTGGTFAEVPTDYIPSYAIIQENTDGTSTVISTYTLTFLPNGGNGVMKPVKIAFGSSIILPVCDFAAPTGKDFAVWEIGGAQYAPGTTYTPTADVTVNAIWKEHQHTGGTATCAKKAVCTVCGKSYGKLGSHTIKDYGTQAATCTETGMEAHSKCTTCGNLYVNGNGVSSGSLIIPALGHQWEDVSAVEATCTEAGMKAYRKCSRCDALQADGKPAAESDLSIAAPGHTLEAIAATQATCTQAGIQAHNRCTGCGQLFVNNMPVDAAALTTASSSHVLADWISDASYHWKACVDCGEVFRQSTHADTDLDDVCDDCGYTMMPVSQNSDEAATFSSMFLIPMGIAAVLAAGVAIMMALKKRK